jgi:hypothetical protein
VVDKVVLGQVFLWVLWFSCQYHSIMALHTHIWEMSNRPIGSSVQRHEGLFKFRNPTTELCPNTVKINSHFHNPFFSEINVTFQQGLVVM